MPLLDTQMAVLVSASPAGDVLRRDLASRGVALASATASLARLRRSLVRGCDAESMVLCITLDQPTLRRHRRGLTRLLDDRCSFVTPLHAIGVMIDGTAGAGWESIGCDALASHATDVRWLLDRFACLPTCLAGRMGAPRDLLQGRITGLMDLNGLLSRRADTYATDLRRLRP
jgi:hypothetical protein